VLAEPGAEVVTIPSRRKAAILALALGSELSAEVFKFLGPDEIDELVLEIAALDNVSADEKQVVLEEFWAVAQAQDFITQGGIAYAKDVLERALGGEKALEIMGRLSSYIRLSPFEFLRRVEPQQIYNFLQNEHPQTVALVLSYLESESAATCMSMFSPDLQGEVAMRIAVMDRTAPEVIREVEQVMERKLSAVINQELAAAGGVKSLVDILNFVDRATERTILDSLDERDQELGEDVRKLMFVFEDLSKLDPGGVQTLLRTVEKDQLALALKGASDALRDMFFSNMSERAAKIMREDMETMGPVRLREVEQAQMAMVQTAKDLANKGEIVLVGAGGDDDELVY